MSEIKVNLVNLDGAITRLNTLAAKWSANPATPPATVGSGKTANELEELAQMYKEMNDHMASLARNTAAFFTNVKNIYQENDHKAATNISGK